MERNQVIRGLMFPNVTFGSRENIEGTLDYLPKDGDIIIVSYPKSGSTWLCYIVQQITSQGESFPSFTDLLYKKVPNMEFVGSEGIDNLTGVRMYKNHYRYDMVKKNPRSKVLYIYRRSEDVVVSYHRFIQEIWDEKVDLDEFFNEFLAGNVAYGNYFEHIMTYWSHKYDKNLFLISYEELLASPKHNILRIAKFLGGEYYEYLSKHESALNKILEQTSFEYIKKKLPLEFPRPNSDKNSPSKNSKKTINFFRKGVIGDGKKSLSPDKLKYLREVAREVIKNRELLQEWFEEH